MVDRTIRNPEKPTSEELFTIAPLPCLRIGSSSNFMQSRFPKIDAHHEFVVLGRIPLKSSLVIELDDLAQHQCVNTRYSRRGRINARELEKGKRNLQVRGDGPWAFNSIYPVLDAALAGFGLDYVAEENARPHVVSGQLQRALKDRDPTFLGLHIFYATRGESSPACR